MTKKTVKRDIKILRRNSRLLQSVLFAGSRVGAEHNNTLWHVAAVGCVHLYKQLLDNDTLGNFQSADISHFIMQLLFFSLDFYPLHTDQLANNSFDSWPLCFHVTTLSNLFTTVPLSSLSLSLCFNGHFSM